MRPILLFALTGWLATSALGCAADDQPSNGGSSGNATAGNAAGGTGAGGTGAGGTGTAGSAGSAGSQNAAGSGGDCQKYCDCHQNNCAPTPIPGGKSCADFCATFTPEQLKCRTAHCSLAPVEPNNNHCSHAVGILECL